MKDRNKNKPLAELLRPQKIDEVVGQKHILGKDKPLRLIFESKQRRSMIFWGPPGSGKTTIARLSADVFDCEWIELSAVFSGVKDIRAAIEQARSNADIGKATILFVDEIHRFNKAQQDALLPYTESGLITFIGATTENPSFEVNSALLSRAPVFILKPLDDEELIILLEKANKIIFPQLKIDKEARAIIIAAADGDARQLYNLLEQIQGAAAVFKIKNIDQKIVVNAISSSTRRFDKGGEYFYDQISALHKSVRGSDPDAALYWFCRMLESGADPQYLSRRIIRMAWEDIGLADPRALQIVNEAAQTYTRLGSPEGELALAQAVIYLSIAPKSNAGYLAFNAVMDFIKQDKSREVPLHLRNAPTKLMKQAGYGKKYRYAHNEPHGYAAGEQYMPEGLADKQWYTPTNRGLESKIAEKLAFLRKLDEE